MFVLACPKTTLFIQGIESFNNINIFNMFLRFSRFLGTLKLGFLEWRKQILKLNCIQFPETINKT
jgi:hypothetical protein